MTQAKNPVSNRPQPRNDVRLLAQHWRVKSLPPGRRAANGVAAR